MKRALVLIILVIFFLLISMYAQATVCNNDADCEPDGLCNYIDNTCTANFSHLEYYGYYMDPSDISDLRKLSYYTNVCVCKNSQCLETVKNLGMKAIYWIQGAFEYNPESEWDTSVEKKRDENIDFINDILAIYVYDEPPFNKTMLTKMVSITKKYFPGKPTMIVFNLVNTEPPDNLDWIGIDPYFNPTDTSTCAERDRFMSRVWNNTFRIEGKPDMEWSSLLWASQFNKSIVVVGESFQFNSSLLDLFHPMPSVCQQNWYFEASKAYPLVKGLLWFTYSDAKGSVRIECGQNDDIPVFGDYAGDGKDNVALWRPIDGNWYIFINGTFHVVQWGTSGDIPVPADYDGDGKDDIAVWRPSEGRWYIKDNGTSLWGTSGDIPVPADYNGDGKDDIAVWRPSEGRWYIKDIGTYLWGVEGDIPIPADYDGDGKDDIAVFNNETGLWSIMGSQAGSYNLTWGTSGDIPVPADYDGDGKDDIAVWRPSEGRWYIKDIGTYLWGTYGDVPIPMNYYGIGEHIQTVWRKSQTSSNAYCFLNIKENAVTGVKEYPGRLNLHRRIGREILCESPPFPQICGDINIDYYIDVYDLAILSSHFGLTASDQFWNSTIDIVDNGEIDIYDLVFVASRFT